MYKTTLLVVNVIFEGHARIIIKKSHKSFDLQDSLAEREGFEPPVPLSTPVFKTGAFDHSAISPIKEIDRCSLAIAVNYLFTLLY